MNSWAKRRNFVQCLKLYQLLFKYLKSFHKLCQQFEEFNKSLTMAY